MTTTEIDFAGVFGMERCHVDQHPQAPAIGHRELDLFGPHPRGVLQVLGQRKVRQRELAPVLTPARQHLQKLLRRGARGADRLGHAVRLAVDRRDPADAGVEHRHAERRGLDQGLQVRPCTLHVAVRARVCDRSRGLRGEQHHDLLVLVRERLVVLLVTEEEVAEVFPSVVHRRALHRLREPRSHGQVQRGQVAGHIRLAERFGKVPEMLEEPGAFGPHHQLLEHFGRETGAQEVHEPAVSVDRRDDALAAAGQRPRAVDCLPEHRVQIEARTDAQHRAAQPGEAVPERPVLTPQFFDMAHRF